MKWLAGLTANLSSKRHLLYNVLSIFCMYDEIKTEPLNQDTFLETDSISTIDKMADTEMPIDDSTIQDLRRWGFQQAIKNRIIITDADQLIRIYKDKLTTQVSRLNTLYDDIQSRYEEKIKGLRDEKERLKQDVEKDDPTLSDLKKRKEELTARMKEIIDKILAVRREMRQGKEDMLKKWLKDAKENIDEVTELQKKMHDTAWQISQENYEAEKTTLDQHIDHWKNRRTQYQGRLDEVNTHLKRIGADGMSPTIASLLIGIGSSVAAAAGYFFSAYASAASFGNKDAFFFLLSGFFKVGGLTEINFLTKLAVLIIAITAVGGISYLCFRLLRKFFDKKGSSEEVFRIQARGRLSKDSYNSNAELKAGSWFSFWLQVAPAVTIVGIVILLLSLNTSTPDEVNRVNSSIEGMLAGTAVALGICGIMCLYVMKVIEPRLLRRQAQEQQGLLNWLRFNWELAVCLLIFFVTTLAIIFYPLVNEKLPDRFVSAVAIPEFIAVSLLAAFPFAYGVRFRGLFYVSRFLQREIIWLDIHIAEYGTPEIPDVSLDYTKAKGMLENILAALYRKAVILQGIDADHNLKTSAIKEEPVISLSRLRKIGKRIKTLFYSDTTSSPVKELTTLETWEREYFPDIEEEIKLLAFEYKECEAELKTVTNHVDKLEATKSSGKDEQLAKERKIQKDIETILTYKEKASASKLTKLSKIDDLSIKAETAIMEGFDLGIWYRENRLGPHDSYYTALSALPPIPINAANNNGEKINHSDGAK